MTDDTAWFADQQRLHNLNSYRWLEPRPRTRGTRYTFEPWQVAVAMRSLETKETK